MYDILVLLRALIEPREASVPSQCHTARKQPNWDSNSSKVAPELACSSTLFYANLFRYYAY